MSIEVNTEVIITSGLHQYQRGLIIEIETATEIPFAHIALRGAKGQLLQRKSALVPLKYCAEYDEQAAKTVRAATKAARQTKREALEALAAAQFSITVEPLSWE